MKKIDLLTHHPSIHPSIHGGAFVGPVFHSGLFCFTVKKEEWQFQVLLL
jgi:hypothetical protein